MTFKGVEGMTQINDLASVGGQWPHGAHITPGPIYPRDSYIPGVLVLTKAYIVVLFAF